MVVNGNMNSISPHLRNLRSRRWSTQLNSLHNGNRHPCLRICARSGSSRCSRHTRHCLQNRTQNRYYCQVTYMENHTPKASAPNVRQKGSLGLNLDLTLCLTQTRIPTLSLAKPLQPVAPSLVHPVGQSPQMYPPSVFVHLRSWWQSCVCKSHSFTSTQDTT